MRSRAMHGVDSLIGPSIEAFATRAVSRASSGAADDSCLYSFLSMSGPASDLSSASLLLAAHRLYFTSAASIWTRASLHAGHHLRPLRKQRSCCLAYAYWQASHSSKPGSP